MTVPATDRRPPTTENCRFCWMCRHVCPVGHVTSRETLTPHAWALTVESVRRGQLAWNEETARVMYACADCGLCQRHCVTDQPLPDAIAGAREVIVAAGVAPPAVAAHERRVRASIGQPPAGEAAFPRVAGGPVLFAGALVDGSDGVVAAAAALLLASGVRAPVVGRGRATGRVESALGLRALATAMARAVVDELAGSGITEVIVLGPADRWTFEYLYPTRLGVHWPEAVRVTEVTTILAAALEAGRLRVTARDRGIVAYHDPCGSARVDRDHAAPRRLVAAACAGAARELFWRADRAHPCGATGGLEVTHADLARELAAARLRDARATGAATIVTDDPECLAHLRRHQSPGMTVASLYEILAAQLTA